MSSIENWAGDVVLKKKIHGRKVFLQKTKTKIPFNSKWICRVLCTKENKHTPYIHVGVSRNKITAYRKAIHECNNSHGI